MFRDASEELARLEEELLAEEALEQPPEEEPDPWLYEDTRPGKAHRVYKNYSNDYGNDLRNYATGYRAYNSDETDQDLESYSREVRRRGGIGAGCLMAIILALTLVVAAGVILIVAKERGLL